MTVRIIRRDDLRNTSRHIQNDTYETVRFLLQSDGLGVTVTDIVLQPGIEETYGHEKHIEIAYCIEGSARIDDEIGGGSFLIEPGTMWVAQKGSRFRFCADLPTRLICVFTPPFAGHETGFAADADSR